MKASYRAKYNALLAQNDGHAIVTIKRCDKTVAVWIDEIIDTPNGQQVPEYEVLKGCFDVYHNSYPITFKELINYSK